MRTAAGQQPLTINDGINNETIDDMLKYKDDYLAAAAGAALPDDWVDGQYDNTGQNYIPRPGRYVLAAATVGAGNRRQRRRFQRGGWQYLKEEDWVTFWWRQRFREFEKAQERAKVAMGNEKAAADKAATELAWVPVFVNVVEELSLVALNAAMVERMWSLFGAMFNSNQDNQGPEEKERCAQARFNCLFSVDRAL